MIQVDGKKMAWSKDMTIASLLSALKDAHWCAVVRLNGTLVSSPDFSGTRIPDNSKVELLPLVAGG